MRVTKNKHRTSTSVSENANIKSNPYKPRYQKHQLPKTSCKIKNKKQIAATMGRKRPQPQQLAKPKSLLYFHLASTKTEASSSL